MGEKYDLDEILAEMEQDQAISAQSAKGKVSQADIQKLLKAKLAQAREKA
ncbi:MAG: hypothetical protein V1816_27015 [Pseudomonadota bacterium]